MTLPDFIKRDGLIPLDQAASHLTFSPPASTLERWGTEGFSIGTSGERVFLRLQQHHGQLVTTPEWIDEFDSAIADATRQTLG